MALNQLQCNVLFISTINLKTSEHNTNVLPMSPVPLILYIIQYNTTTPPFKYTST